MIIGAIAFVVIAGGVYASMNINSDVVMVKEQTEQRTMDDKKMTKEKALMEKKEMEEKETMMEEDTMKSESMVEEDETSMMDEGDTMMKAGSYEVYAPEKVALASTSNDVVLFFRASWCPSCRAVDADVKAHLKDIPSSLIILDVDYDNSALLKKRHGVTYQHTFVQVDKDGNLIKKWSGSGTLAALVVEVQ